MDNQHVGVIGAGTMGNGIAQISAVAGLQVSMVDISDEAVQRGIKTVSGSLARLVAKDKLSEADSAAALGRIAGATDYAALKQADIIIEAATENIELKLRILRQDHRGTALDQGIGDGPIKSPGAHVQAQIHAADFHSDDIW